MRGKHENGRLLASIVPAGGAATAAAGNGNRPPSAAPNTEQQRRAAPAAARAPHQARGCWRETPAPLRELAAWVAGLPLEVTQKIDRELSEAEKAKLRAAAGKIREGWRRWWRCDPVRPTSGRPGMGRAPGQGLAGALAPATLEAMGKNPIRSAPFWISRQPGGGIRTAALLGRFSRAIAAARCIRCRYFR